MESFLNLKSPYLHNFGGQVMRSESTWRMLFGWLMGGAWIGSEEKMFQHIRADFDYEINELISKFEESVSPQLRRADHAFWIDLLNAFRRADGGRGRSGSLLGSRS